MKKLKFNYQVAFLLLLLFTAFSCAKPEKKPSDEADITAINELYNQATLACSTGDAEMYLTIFTEDAVYMPQDFPPIVGKEELRPLYQDFFGAFDVELPYTIDKIEVTGDKAFVSSSFQYSTTAKEGGETITRPGKQLDILKKHVDGSWKIYIQSWSYNAPPVVE